MKKCEHGTLNCVHAGKSHDDDCCFDGIFRHEYVCQECGHTEQAMIVSDSPKFPAKKCPKCGTPSSLV
jgi:hypothetical protein